MPEQPDLTRRAELKTRAAGLREKANQLMGELEDEGAKDWLQATVLNTLDDVEGFFLKYPTTHPSAQWFESQWLNYASMQLHGAEEQFKRYSADIQRYGGPKNVRVIG
jgi:hypothetical protein